MDMTTFEQFELTADQVGDNKDYLLENMNVDITQYEGELLGITLPEKMTFTVVRTDPAVRGGTQTNATKEAWVETGLMVRVPLFIEQDEKIIVSTADGKYVSRA